MWAYFVSFCVVSGFDSGFYNLPISIEVQSIGSIPFSKHRKMLSSNIVCEPENIFDFVIFFKWSYFCHFTPSLSMFIILLVIVLSVV